MSSALRVISFTPKNFWCCISSYIYLICILYHVFLIFLLAVDIWAVGVIMLCILSGTYPFFRAPDDVTALAEMITLFGDQQMKKVARMFGRHLMCSEKKSPLDLRKVCYRLRNRGTGNASTENCEKCEQFVDNCLCVGESLKVDDDLFPDSAYDLLKKLLDVDPFTRISAEEALKHPFLNEF